ncbi:SGNH/GDSL hydrolase family protein [Streptacidiphilus monticola]|jgi:lysophospholipase L1-like esterase|uniref:SGNH/GDSL hydrolase family protein n=1 Tax=Streptacidiphilus monticola TaxID=2161674 RepID=A0ABW1G340_9ACTN
MSRARVARRIAAAAAYGGGGIGLLGVGLAGLLLTEAKLAEHTLNTLQGEPPRADGLYGPEFADNGEPPLLLAVLGDSTAAGFGVNRGRETPGALLAGGISSIAERPVRLQVSAFNGATSADLDSQVTEVLGGERVPDLALLMIGANDVTQRLKPAESVRLLGDALRRLRAAGTEVVVGTCPDLGTIEPVRPPLRWLARRASRQLAAAQTIAVVEAGARSVSLGDLLGPEFRGRPEMFASDRYHPSAQGYATASMALLPTLCAALDLWPVPAADAAEQSAVLPVAQAAAAAARQAGTEVSGAEVQGAGSGPRGRWASLLQRRGRNLAERQLSTSDNSHGVGADLGAT